MRVNVYAEEMSRRIEVIEKEGGSDQVSLAPQLNVPAGVFQHQGFEAGISYGLVTTAHQHPFGLTRGVEQFNGEVERLVKHGGSVAVAT